MPSSYGEKGSELARRIELTDACGDARVSDPFRHRGIRAGRIITHRPWKLIESFRCMFIFGASVEIIGVNIIRERCWPNPL